MSYILHREIYKNIRDRTKTAGLLTDICDSEEIYQKHVRNGFLENPNNISLSFNTDEVAIFKSSKKGELWP